MLNFQCSIEILQMNGASQVKSNSGTKVGDKNILNILHHHIHFNCCLSSPFGGQGGLSKIHISIVTNIQRPCFSADTGITTDE